MRCVPDVRPRAELQLAVAIRCRGCRFWRGRGRCGHPRMLQRPSGRARRRRGGGGGPTLHGAAVFTAANSGGALGGVVRDAVGIAVGEIRNLLNVRRFHVPPVGTPRRFRPPQPLPSGGRLAEVVHLPAGPMGGAASAPPGGRRLGAGDRARVNRWQPRLGWRLAIVL